MITKNFKAICALILQTVGNYTLGMLPIKDTSGTIVYAGANPYSQYPRAFVNTLALAATTAGIVLGTGTTEPTEDDYKIETPITSGISATVAFERGIESGNPYVEFTLVVTNSTADSISISEIAFNQTVACTDVENGTTAVNKVICLDHTKLSSPVNIAAGAQGIIKYNLKSVII